MIIVCKTTLKFISSEIKFVNLTVGKHYIALTDMYDADMMVEVVDDAGEKCWYPKNNFYILQNYREYKLKQLGI
jgi:hypothetical protein